MARINNDNQENINNLKNQVRIYYNKLYIPYFVINYDNCGADNFEIEEYDELQDRIQEIYDNPQDYADCKNIWVEYNYDMGIEIIGYIKGEQE
tara:strand:- start:20 stop:298 length:279 start_codon:yes stop_codon:yes gene_type:complete